MRLGADPEIFLQTKEGTPKSVIGMIGADKWNPLQLDGLPAGFTIQEDNVAMEFGIPPAASADEFVQHIQLVMEESKKYVASDLSFSKLSCTLFPKEDMAHPMSQVFGCEPDFDAWTGKENRKPKPPHEYMRSAGGHIHVETNQDPADVVRKMDLFLSVPAVLMDNGHERKKLYGKAGAHRIKPYGVEYRTPSNFWIAPGGTDEQREKYCRWVWRSSERALAASLDFEKDSLGAAVQQCINENDAGLAKALIDQFELEVV